MNILHPGFSTVYQVIQIRRLKISINAFQLFLKCQKNYYEF